MKNLIIFYAINLILFIYQFSFTQDSTLISFEMKDQFDTIHTHSDFENKILIVIGSDKTGSQYNNQWIEAIVDSLEHRNQYQYVEFLGVADLRGVPFFLKGYVKGKFPDEKNRWVLMDWDGKFAKNYQFKSDVCNIAVFDRKGELVYQTFGTQVDINKLNEILMKINAVVQSED